MMRTIFAFVASAVAVAAAQSRGPIWSRPARSFPDVVVFGDGSAVVTTTSTSVVSYDQATGATLADLPTGSTLSLLETADPTVMLAFLANSSVVALEGKTLTKRFMTPPLQSVHLCGADTHVALLTGMNSQTLKWEVHVVDLTTGATVTQIQVPAWVLTAQCTFLGDHIFTTPLGRPMSPMSDRPRDVPKQRGTRFHKGQRPQQVHHVKSTPATKKTPATGAFFIRTNKSIARYSYAIPRAGDAVAEVRIVWITQEHFDGDSFLITPDETTLVLGFRLALDTATGSVRNATAIPKTLRPDYSVMYRGSMALLPLFSKTNEFLVYDFAALKIVKTVKAVSTRAECFRSWTNNLVLQLLPKSKLLIATGIRGCTLAFDYDLKSVLPIGEPSGNHFGFLDSPATPGAVLAHGVPPEFGTLTLDLISTSTWEPQWTMPLAKSDGDDDIVGPKGQRIFVHSSESITAYSLV